MKYLLMFLAACVVAADVYGQTTVQVKLYQNSDFFKATYTTSGNPPYSREVQNHHFDRLTVAVNLTGKKNWMHELELFIPEISKTLSHVQFPRVYSFRESSNYSSHVSTYAFRYEMSKIFNSDRRFYYGLGLGINPYYNKMEYDALTTTRYDITDEVYGVGVNVIPRIAFKITEKLRVDVNVPLEVYDLRREKMHVANPSIPVRHQNFASTAHDFFEHAYTVRVGIAYVLK